MAPEANCFNSFVRILENAISLGKTNKNQKSHKILFDSLSKTHENT